MPPANYVDGGLRKNNPVREVSDEAKLLWGSWTPECPTFIVSIGTGLPPLRAVGENAKDILKALADIATDTQQTADEFDDEIGHAVGQGINYVRLNVTQGLEGILLEEWHEFERLTGATDYYSDRHRKEIQQCAYALAGRTGM